jgi:hypothetical protein
MHTQYGIEYAFNNITKLVDKYHKYGYLFALDWEVMQYYNPRYDEKIEVVVPQFVVEFVH